MKMAAVVEVDVGGGAAAEQELDEVRRLGKGRPSLKMKQGK